MALGLRRTQLALHLPWAGRLRPGLVVTTSGALLTTFLLRGPDVESLTEEALGARAAQLAHLINRYGYGWALHWEARRVPARTYPTSAWPDTVTRVIDAERAALYADAEAHFVTYTWLTLIYQTPRDRTQHFWRWLYEQQTEARPVDYASCVEAFEAEATLLRGVLQGLFPRVERLGDDALATYLHSCCSLRYHPVAMPRQAAFLSHQLADMPLDGGEEPRLGESYLRVLSLGTWPMQLLHGMMAILDTLPLEYRYVTRWLPLDKDQARGVAHTAQRKWLQKRKGLVTMLREEVFKRESAMVEPEADTRRQDAVDAQDAIAAGAMSLGYVTARVIVWDQDAGRIQDKVDLVLRTLTGEGFTVIVERAHAVDAWLETMPGTMYGHVRQVPMSSHNFLDIAPTTAMWQGFAHHPHFGGPPLAYATTGGSTPFGLALHDTDVGHTTFIGPPGSGKDTLLWFLASQFARYPDSQVFVLDKGHGSRCLTTARGGVYEALLGAGAQPGQPLAQIDDPVERIWAASWLADRVTEAHQVVTPAVHAVLEEALALLAGYPPAYRTLTNFCVQLQDETLRQVFRRYTYDGPYGMLLDGDSEALHQASMEVLALDTLLTLPEAIAPVLAYRIHRWEQRLRADRPTLFIYNEFGEYLPYPILLRTVQQQLTQVRKLNASVWVAAQSINQTTSDVIGALSNDVPTRIYLPNIHAEEEEVSQFYQRWGLNRRQRHLLAAALPKKHYYLVHRDGARLLDFQFGPVTLAFTASGRGTDLAMIDTLQAGTATPDDFVLAWLHFKRLGYAARALEQAQLHGKEVLI